MRTVLAGCIRLQNKDRVVIIDYFYCDQNTANVNSIEDITLPTFNIVWLELILKKNFVKWNVLVKITLTCHGLLRVHISSS